MLSNNPLSLLVCVYACTYLTSNHLSMSGHIRLALPCHSRHVLSGWPLSWLDADAHVNLSAQHNPNLLCLYTCTWMETQVYLDNLGMAYRGAVSRVQAPAAFFTTAFIT